MVSQRPCLLPRLPDGKIEVDTTGSPLNCPRKHRASRSGGGNSGLPTLRPRALHAPLPRSTSPTAAAASRVVGSTHSLAPPYPARPHGPPRPAPPAGTWNVGTGAGTHAARPPVPSPLRIPRIPAGGARPAWGLSPQKPAGAPPPRGGWTEGCSPCPAAPSLRGLLPRKTETLKLGEVGLQI